jgi:cell fate regulator YaaT (PSP1 superfamily)
MGQPTEEEKTEQQSPPKPPVDIRCYYRIRFREEGREFTIQTPVEQLAKGSILMVKTEHGMEPATVVDKASDSDNPEVPRRVTYFAPREANQEEQEKFSRLPGLEEEAYAICKQRVEELDLPMHLVRVERFFNGSKIIFYFTAESRVDFRELVKRLVQEFRTRVEMRQIGVRHETQMTGGIGPCGRELCCSSFLKKFDSVSIKMAKVQELPLNPAKISGLCNRLLCCLTYEYETYRDIKKEMPKIGKLLKVEGTTYRITRQMPLGGTVQAVSNKGEEITLNEKQWQAAEPVHKKPKPKQSASKKK